MPHLNNKSVIQTIILIGIGFLIFSCSKKSVELPQITITGETDVYNYSQIWVFLKADHEKTKAQINKNNTISTTHWIINADKKLPMTEMLSVMGMVHNNRSKKSIHSSEDMHNYLSYSNPKDKKIQLYMVDNVQLLSIDSLSLQKIIVAYQTTDYILKFSDKHFELNNVKFDYNNYNVAFFDTLAPKNIHLFFKQSINYQHYLEKRLMLKSYLKPEIKVDATEYFYE